MKTWQKLWIWSCLSACAAYDLGDTPPFEIEVSAQDPSWAKGIQKLVAAKCDSCHRTGENEFEPYPARFYKFDLALSEAQFQAHLALSCYRLQLKSDPMPPLYATPLTENEERALLNYCEQNLQ